MKTICLYFQVHQPLRLRQYRFFDIGNSDYYYDDYTNETILRKVAENCYLPANKMMLDLIKKHKGKFRVAFSISGVAIDQFRLYAPEVIQSFQELAKTGCVEFLAETYFHSLAALKDKSEFKRQVESHANQIERLFGQRPKTFRNTELIYSDEIGAMVSEMGFKTILTEGASHILKWKSLGHLYVNAINPRLKVMTRNFQLSDDIAFRFSDKGWSEWPLSAKKYVSWINCNNTKDELVNLFMNYEIFGEHQKKETGIFKFLQSFPSAVFNNSQFNFMTPSDVAENYQPVAILNAPQPISWVDQERNLTAWLGNELQNEAFSKLYELSGKINLCSNKDLLKDWQYLQVSDHFYYMCTKFFSDGDVHSYFNPYETPYDAFLNYMNVLNDFTLRLEKSVAPKQKIISIRKKKELEYEVV
ncbi:MAG: polysaccharide deacetylase family protein [Bacteroidetes bacterium]|nr:polysaccharide deacetylase family protein [Bacteroidota bacterium]